MIEEIDRLETEDEWREAVLLQNHRRRKCGFKAVCGAGADDTAKTAQRFTAGLGVIGKIVQPLLHRIGRAKASHETPLGRSERQSRRLCRISSRERELF